MTSFIMGIVFGMFITIIKRWWRNRKIEKPLENEGITEEEFLAVLTPMKDISISLHDLLVNFWRLGCLKRSDLELSLDRIHKRGMFS